MAEPISKGTAAADLESAIAEAVAGSEVTQESDEDLDEAFAAEFGEDADETAEPPSTAEPPQASESASETPEGTDEELPDSYWGVDLTGIPVEQKRELLAHLQQQDGTIRKLQAKLSEPLEVAPAEEAEPDEVTDAQLLEAVGIDPEDFNIPDAFKAAAVKMARNQLALEDQVARLNSVEAGRTMETQWNRELDKLEATYGDLPGTREEVLRYALKEDVLTPADLYFQLTAPVKREVESLAAKARREAGKREQSAGVKPRSSSAEPAPVQPGMSLRDAVKSAAQAAQKETGMSWKSALKRRLVPTPEGSDQQ